MTAPAPPARTDRPAPTLALMHFAFVLAGLGTLLLGPILPLLAARWYLTDAQSGLLVLAQFCGATLGGATTSARLVRGLTLGLAAAALGLACFAIAPGVWPACAAIAAGGFGIGRIIATINILAGLRHTERRGAVLARLNFSWSLGALLSPLLAAWLAPRVPLPALLGGFALLLGLALALLLVQRTLRPGSSEMRAGETAGTRARRGVFAYYTLLILIYGGLETCLSAWLTTYALRYGRTSLVLSEYTLVLLLAGLTAGRALAAGLLARLPDRTVQRASLALSGVCAAALTLAPTGPGIAVFAVLLGLCLAPVFPSTFSLFMGFRPPASQAGLVLAASGIGAAALPWLMGVVSAHTGSLRLALVLPVGAAVAMLVITAVPPSEPQDTAA